MPTKPDLINKTRHKSNTEITRWLELAKSPEQMAVDISVTRMTVDNRMRLGEVTPFEALLIQEKYGLDRSKLAPQVKHWPVQCQREFDFDIAQGE